MFVLPGDLEAVLATAGLFSRGTQSLFAAAMDAGAAAAAGGPLIKLASGHVLDLGRSRWDGPLDTEALNYCREHGVALCYDCAQLGWVPQASVEDLNEADINPIERPDATADALHAAAATRLRARQLATAGTPSDLAEDIAAEVREFRSSNGFHAASALHLALNAIVHQEMVRPTREPAEAGVFSFRPWRFADVPDYRRMLENPRLWEFMPEPMPAGLSDETTRALIELGSVAGHQEAMAVEHGGRPVGQCLLRFDEPFAGVRAAEVAYWLDEEHWGKGWMPRILPAFLQRGFATHAIDVVYAWIRGDHAASQRVAEKAGFTRDTFEFEAELAEATRRDGFVRFVTFRPDWPA